METVRVEGMEEALKTLDEIAKEFPKKVVAAGMRKATRPFTKELKRVAPEKNFGKIVKVKAFTKGRNPVIGVGAFHSPKSKVYGKTSKTDIPYWYVWYWTDYGTLSRRQRGHQFVRGRKKDSRTWKGGIRPRNTVEKAWARTRNMIVANMSTELQKQAKTFIERNYRK